MYVLSRNASLRSALAAACAFAALQAGAQVPQSAVAPSGATVATPQAQPPAVTIPSSPMSAATAARIQEINEQMALLQAQLNQLELQAKIAEKQKEIRSSGGQSDVQSSFDKSMGNPSVVSVSGLKGNLEAVLVFPGGVTQRVRAGDVIDDRRVAKVAINEVVLTDLRGRNVQRLAFGSAPVVRESQTVNGERPGAPMPMGTPPGRF